MIRTLFIGILLSLSFGLNAQTELKEQLQTYTGEKFKVVLDYLESTQTGTDWAPIVGLGDRYQGVMVWTDKWNIYAKFDKAFSASAWMSPHQRSLLHTVSSFTVVKRD